MAALMTAGGLAVAGLTLGAGPAPAVADDPGPTGSGGYLAPYYTTGDLTGDQQITEDDLDELVAALGTTSDDAGWDAVEPADHDDDGTITITDVTALSGRIVYDDGSLDLVEASALDLQKAMNAGVVTSVQLTRQYLDRIAAYDTTVVDTSATGRALNSIIATGGEALAAAEESDAYRAEHDGPRSMLDGIPILLKDNYDTADLPTSAGCGCWADNQTEDDAHMVTGLRDAGAVVLGKASLDEFAYGFVSEFSTLSAPGSTKLVASPYNTARTAGGSSGGTGAAVAANLSAIGFGTDTGGSIRVPSSYNQLVGIRPTVGLASRDGIVPLALTQDTGGPIARSVSDAAIALDAVVGTDEADPATADADAHVPESYTSYLDPTALEGEHFGYLASMVSPNATVTRLFDQAVADLEAQGATVEPITIDGINPILSEGSGSTNEFKHDLDEYIAAHLDPDETDRSLDAILASGHFVTSRRSTYTQRNNVTQEQYESWIASHTAVIEQGNQLVTGALDANDLDALIYPTAVPYGTYSTNLRLSPNTGLPAVSVPMGQATAEDGTVTGAGVNLEMLGRDWSEGDLIGAAYSYEQATEHRTTPALYGTIDGDLFAGTGSDEDAEPGDGTVTLDAPATVEAGETFTVTVEQSAVEDYGYELAVDYDESRLSYVEGSAETTDTGYTAASADDGEVSVVHTKLGTSPATNGDLTLATLTFTAERSGPATLSVPELTTVTGAGGATTGTDLASTSVEVGMVPTRTTVTARPDPVRSGKKLTAIVRVGADDAAPTGSVTLGVGRRVVRDGVRLVDGVARVAFNVKGAGTKTLRAVYVPRDPYAASRDTTGFRVLRR